MLACVAALGTAARADSLVSLPEPHYAAPSRNPQQDPLPERITALVYPTIGCPALVPPGGDLAPVILLPDGGGTMDWSARIETSRDLFVQSHALRFRGSTFDAATGTYRLLFQVPPEATEDTYDLVIESAGLPQRSGADVQPNAVRILKARNDYDFIHIADTQIRDPTTRQPQKFEQLLEEVKLLDPAFTLFSGDLNFGMDYVREYEENWAILRNGAVPVWMAPGNHDGYAWLLSPTSALYDGLHLWRRTMGPTYFAFRWQGLRFIAANSYGNDLQRRNAYTFLCHNSGGHIEAAQLAWIDAQGAAATAAGEEAFLFLHHNPHPSRGLRPGVPGYPWSASLVGAAQGVWNVQSSRDEMNRILGAHKGLRWVLAGHTNDDQHLIETLGAGASAHEVHYVNTTSPCNGGDPREGYRVMKVRGGRVAETDYRPTQPSVPFPLGGNLRATYLDANDGSQSSVRVEVANALEEPVEVTLKLFVRQELRGYMTTAGRIREVGQTDLGPWVVYLRLPVPAQGTAQASVAVAPQGGGARTAALGGTPPGGATAGTIVGTSGGASSGGGGCAARAETGTAGGGAIAGSVLPLLVLALGLVFARAGSRAGQG